MGAKHLGVIPGVECSTLYYGLASFNHQRRTLMNLICFDSLTLTTVPGSSYLLTGIPAHCLQKRQGNAPPKAPHGVVHALDRLNN